MEDLTRREIGLETRKDERMHRKGKGGRDNSAIRMWLNEVNC